MKLGSSGGGGGGCGGGSGGGDVNRVSHAQMPQNLTIISETE